MRVPIRLKLVFAGVLLVVLLGASPAFGQSPWWHVASNMRPSTLKRGGDGTLVVQALNVGDGATSGPITVTDTLPVGVTVRQVSPEGTPEPEVSFVGGASDGGLGSEEEGRFHGSGLGPEEELGFFHACSEPAPREVRCMFEEFYSGFKVTLRPYEFLELGIGVRAEEGASVSGGEGEVEVTGGTAPIAQAKQPLAVSDTPPAFGVEEFSFVPEAEGGGVDTQAGSHPFQLTVGLGVNQNTDPLTPPALTRSLQFKLPTGFVGNTTAVPQCSEVDFSKLAGGAANLCPENTVIGVASFTFDEPVFGGEQTVSVPLFNLVPARGEPARFGFEYVGVPVKIDTSVRTGSDYGVTTTVSNITQLANFQSEVVTFWGVPGESSHDSARGWGCLDGGLFDTSQEPCTALGESNPKPFLTLPTSCASPWVAKLEGQSWPTKADPAGLSFPASPVSEYSLKDGFGRPVGITGCNQLPFAPSVEVSPDVQEASTASGVSVHVRVPQEVSENAVGLASSSVKDIVVALPEGMGLNPAGADGLEACGEAEVGYLPGESAPPADLHFTPTLPEPLESGVNFCPDASKIATVKIKTPLLPNQVEGAVYLAAQNQNPFGSLVAIYIIAQDPVSGFVAKLPGEVSLDSRTGRIVTRFLNSPQLPFEDAELHFFGGDRAPLGTPALCGSYTTDAEFTPWSAERGEQPHQVASTFDIMSGPNGGPCQAPSPFDPTLTAGTSSVQAGGFSPFVTTFSRPDGDQDLQGVQLHMPPGLLGIVSSVTPCAEAQANAGTCTTASLIGHTVVSVGLGSNPYSVTGGTVFLTGPYEGAPYGLSIVNPAKAGPFDLGNVVVRAKIEVDPLTSNLTVTTDPSGPHSIPHILDGIPLQIQHVNVSVDRPGFIFNPTSCEKTQVGGSLTSDRGASSALSVPFQVTNCATLAFKPKLTVKTSGKTSRKNGTSLAIRIAYPKHPIGSEAWFKSAKFDFPKQLPARLTTLQKACPQATFDANPAGCPPGSRVGTAIVHTQVLPQALTGVVYFVSYGGAKFPEAVIVLQGDNVTVDLHAETFISKTGVTSATLRNIPGVPFEDVEVVLPSGPNSEFAANGNLCAKNPKMSTAFTAQNALAIHQTTTLQVTNCPKHKSAAKRRKGKKRK
jgi:hypothetical protein